MSNLFKDHHRVLVYLPGAGGEYITSVLSGQTVNFGPNLAKGWQNRHYSKNIFPGHEELLKFAHTLPKVHGEWTEECRLNFSNEMAIKKFINNKEPNNHWGIDKEENLRVPLVIYDTGNIRSNKKPEWFPTHYDFGVFRMPVWHWLDCDNPYWSAHWAFCSFFKATPTDISNNKLKMFELLLRHLNTFDVVDNRLFRPNEDIYRNYYNQKFSKYRISVDNESFQNETNYITWAEENLKAIGIHLSIKPKSALGSTATQCWEYLNDCLPR